MAIIHVDFADEHDKNPLVAITGRLVTAGEIHFSKEDGLTIIDQAGKIVIARGKATANENDSLAAQIQRYFCGTQEKVQRAAAEKSISADISEYFESEG